MPVQGPPWTEFLSCHVCFNMFNEKLHRPISLGCGHTVCKTCLGKMQHGKCPFDQSPILRNVDDLPVNYALLQLVGVTIPDGILKKEDKMIINPEHLKYYESSNQCITDMAVFLKTVDPNDMMAEEDDSKKENGNLPGDSILSRPMQRRLVTLVHCQLIEEEGRLRAMRAARSLGERTVTELILQHQNPHQLSANLWAAVRARGCQFLGPAMQEEVLKLILLVLEDASALSRKVLVLFVVQQLEESYPQASKTAIGHVVQLLYRASCFKVTKREEESSLMQLKEDFRSYEALRREHDSQIVQIAMEAGLRISPEQWSSLLYGDTGHKSHMQSIIDKLQTPQAFNLSINELAVALHRTSDPCNLMSLRPHLEFLASIDSSLEAPPPSWENLEAVLKTLCTVVEGFVDYFSSNNLKKGELFPLQNTRYKTSMCRDQSQQGTCPRGGSCTFAHSQEELEKYRARSRKLVTRSTMSTFTSLSVKERAELEMVQRVTFQKLENKLTGPSKKDQNITSNYKLPSFDEENLSQPMSTLNLSPKCELADGLPRGNLTPGVSAPVQYRKPSLGSGSSVKETYYHPRVTQGATQMTSRELPRSDETSHNAMTYQMSTYPSQGYPPNAMPPNQVPMMSHSYGNSYMMCDSQRTASQAYYCHSDHVYGQTDGGMQQPYRPCPDHRQCPDSTATLTTPNVQYQQQQQQQPPQSAYTNQSPSSFYVQSMHSLVQGVGSPTQCPPPCSQWPVAYYPTSNGMLNTSHMPLPLHVNMQYMPETCSCAPGEAQMYV